jgi:hypothetical protein
LHVGRFFFHDLLKQRSIGAANGAYLGRFRSGMNIAAKCAAPLAVRTCSGRRFIRNREGGGVFTVEAYELRAVGAADRAFVWWFGAGVDIAADHALPAKGLLHSVCLRWSRFLAITGGNKKAAFRAADRTIFRGSVGPIDIVAYGAAPLFHAKFPFDD